MRNLLFWLLTRGRWPLLWLLALVTLLMATGLARLRVEQDTQSMTSSRPEQLAAHEQLRELFGNDDILLLSLTPPQLLSDTGLSLLAELTSDIAALDGVGQVLSLTTAKRLVAGRYGAELQPLLPAGEDAAFSRTGLSDILNNDSFYQGLLISTDKRTAGLVIVPEERAVETRNLPKLIDALRHLMAGYANQAELHLTGVPVQKSDVADYIRRDQQVVLPIVVLVLVIMLTLIFRRPSGVLLPLAATAISMVWTMGFYALCGFELNTISALLPPVVMILAISNSVHLYNGWLQLEGDERERSTLWAGKVAELLTPCSFTALTTSCGLLSLTLSSVPAVRQFGLFAAVGVLFSLLISLILVPIGLGFLPLPGRRLDSETGLLRQVLAWTAETSIRRAPVLLLLALVLLVIALLAIPRLQNNTNLVAFLQDDAPLAVDTAYIDRHLGGVNSLDFMVSRSDGQPLDKLADYRVLERFEQLAKQHHGVARVISVLPILRQLNRAETASATAALPDNPDELRYQLELLGLTENHQQVRRFLTEDRKTARISVMFHDLGSNEALASVRALEEEGAELFRDQYRLVPTGSFYQIILDSSLLVRDMLKSFTLSLCLVMLALLVLLRSFRLTLLAMIPNLIPIIWTLGIMGGLGIDLSTGTAMIGAVAFGLAVDDTIHYLVHFRRVRPAGVEDAVRSTTTKTGRALMITTLVLALGFWTGCLGSFKPTIYFSLLVGSTLVGALLCDLLLLPSSLMLWPSASQRKLACRG